MHAMINDVLVAVMGPGANPRAACALCHRPCGEAGSGDQSGCSEGLGQASGADGPQGLGQDWLACWVLQTPQEFSRCKIAVVESVRMALDTVNKGTGDWTL